MAATVYNTSADSTRDEIRLATGICPERRPVRFPALLFLLCLLWAGFYTTWRSLPYIRPGSEVVYQAKAEDVDAGVVFPASVPQRARIAVIGNSKVLTGFVPRVFDSLVPGSYSVNLGNPDESHYAWWIETLARRGQAPGVVILTLPWSVEESEPGYSDESILRAVFPFRGLMRDCLLFLVRAQSRGGVRAYYRFGERAVAGMRGERGWYFIEGQSHYADDQLPADFRLPSDRPDVADDPQFLPQGAEFRRLETLARRYDIRFLIAPTYHRAGELAEPPAHAGSVAARLVEHPWIRVFGPGYLLFPPEDFADPVHLNPAGARVYTERLARMAANAL